MVIISLADLYYKVEDRWFDLLDWIEAHRIPVYKIIDPLEKRGIPSLPVFVAVALILLYLLISLLGGGAAFTVHVQDSSGSAITDAGIIILKGNNAILTGTIDSGGNYRAQLELGEYSAKVSSEGCDKNPHEFTVDNVDGWTTITLACGADMASKKFCVTPADAGEVSVGVRNSGGVLQQIFPCGTTYCDVTIESSMYYTFYSDTHSSERYSYPELNALGAGECVVLTDQSAQEQGTYTVIVKDNLGSPVENTKVQLVSASDGKTDVINPGYTDDQGKAVFTADVGTSFKIFVPSPVDSQLSSFMGSDTFTFRKVPGTYAVNLQKSSATIFVTVTDGSNPIPGVMLSIMSENDNTVVYFTNSSGQRKFAADIGETYRVGFYKAEYAYKEEEMVGGSVKTVTMTKIGKTQTGTIRVSVVRSDNEEVPISGAVLTLYSDDELELGYPKPVTGEDGVGVIAWVAAGSYCVIATRDAGEPNTCEEGSVDVSANKESAITIALDPAEYKLSVKVLTVGGAPAFAANVSLLDKWRTLIEKKQTNENGYATFKVVDSKDFIVNVLYFEGGQGFKAEQVVSALTADKNMTIQLANLETKLNFIGIFSDSEEAIGPLESGSVYEFRFSLGIPNISGNRWDSIESKFAIEDTKYALFNDRLTYEIDPFGDLNTEITPDDFDDKLDGSKTVKITADYEPSDITLYWDVPVTVQSDFEGTKTTRVSYNGKWVSGNLVRTDPASGVNYYPFEVTKASAIITPDQMSIALSVLNGTTEYPATADGFSAEIYSDFKLVANITNLGDKNYSGIINITQSTFMVKILAISTGGKYEASVKYWENASVTIPSYRPLQPGESVKIVMDVTAVHSGIANLPIYTNSRTEYSHAFAFAVYGNVAAHSVISPSSINEFTTEMTMYAEDNEGHVLPVYEIQMINLSGTSLQHPCYYWAASGEFNEIVIDQAAGLDAGKFIVDFVQLCPLIGPGTLGIAVTTKTQDYNVADLSMDVAGCFVGLSAQKTAVAGEITDISTEISEGACADSGITYDALWAEKQCGDTCKLYSDSSGTDEIASGESVSATEHTEYLSVPLYFNYPAIGLNNIETNVSVNFTAYSESDVGRIQKNKSEVISLTVVPPESDEPVGPASFSPYFIPLSIQRFDTSLDCESNYCTIEQVLKYINSTYDLDCADYSDFEAETVHFKMVDQGWTAAPFVAASEYLNNDVSNGVTTIPDITEDGFTGKYIAIDGDGALVGYNTIEIKKDGVSADACYTELTATNLEPAYGELASLIQLYMPVTTRSYRAVSDSVLRTSYSDTAVETLLKTQWGISDYSENDLATYDHQIFTEIDDSMGTVAKASIDFDHKIHIAGQNPAMVERMINSLTAYVNPNDEVYVNPASGYEFLVVKDNEIIFGGDLFNVNMSQGSILGSSLKSAVISTIEKQISVDPSYDILLQNGKMPDSFFIIATGDPLNPPEGYDVYKTRFSEVWGNNFAVPDKGIAWFDGSGDYAYGESSTVVNNLLNTWLGSPSSGYKKLGDNLVVQYDAMPMDQLAGWIVQNQNDLVEGGVNSTIVNATPAAFSCKIDLPSVGLVLDGVSGWTSTFEENGIYLITLKKTASGTIVYAKTLRHGAPAIGNACSATVPGDGGEITPVPIICTPDHMDLLLFGFNTTDGKAFVDIVRYSSITDKIEYSTSKTRLKLNEIYTSAYGIKVADILGGTNGAFDGTSEIILFVNSDEGKKLVVLNKNDGSKTDTEGELLWTWERVFNLPSGTIDFAVTDWNGDQKPDLALWMGDKIVIFENSALARSGTLQMYTDSSQTNVMPNVSVLKTDDTSDKIDAFMDGGYAMLLLAERGTNDAYDSGWAATYKNVTVKFGSTIAEYWKTGRDTFVEFDAENTDTVIRESATEKELLGLRQTSNDLSDNNIFAYTLSGLPKDGKMITNADTNYVKYDLNTKDMNAERVFISNLDLTGEPEIIQIDFVGSTDGIAIYTGSSESFNENYISVNEELYVGISAFDWETNCGPRIA